MVSMHMLASIMVDRGFMVSMLDSSMVDRGFMVSMLASIMVDRGFKSQFNQTKDYKIGICCFSNKNTALRRKSKYCLAQIQDNVFKWSDMSSCRLLLQ
jgi:hypothetical protein